MITFYGARWHPLSLCIPGVISYREPLPDGSSGIEYPTTADFVRQSVETTGPRNPCRGAALRRSFGHFDPQVVSTL